VNEMEADEKLSGAARDRPNDMTVKNLFIQ
jgi:hypothetical protein